MFAFGLAVALPERISYTVGNALMRLNSFSLWKWTETVSWRFFVRIRVAFVHAERTRVANRKKKRVAVSRDVPLLPVELRAVIKSHRHEPRIRVYRD